MPNLEYSPRESYVVGQWVLGNFTEMIPMEIYDLGGCSMFHFSKERVRGTGPITQNFISVTVFQVPGVCRNGGSVPITEIMSSYYR